MDSDDGNPNMNYCPVSLRTALSLQRHDKRAIPDSGQSHHPLPEQDALFKCLTAGRS